MTAFYPGSIWDGDSGNRDSDEGRQAAPDWRDWDQVIAEVAAAQQQIDWNAAGIVSNPAHTVGVLPSVTGMSAVEYGDGAVHKSIITLAQASVASTDGTTPGTDGAWGNQLLYTFPEGQLKIIGITMTFPVGGITAVTGGGIGFSDTADIGLGIGTEPTANSTEFGLSTTEEDILAEVSAALVAKTTAAIVANINGVDALFDATGAPANMYLNFRTLADADHGTVSDALLFSGTVTVLWSNLGDK